MNDKRTLQTSFNENRISLDVTDEAIQIIPTLISQFEDLTKTLDSQIRRVVVYQTRTFTIENFKKFWDEKHTTPEQRAIRDLAHTLNNMGDTIVHIIDRLTKLEKKEKKEVQKAKSQPIVEWHQRLQKGEKKAKKLNSIIELAGLQVAQLTKRGNPEFAMTYPHHVRCIVYIERIYDELGEDSFQKICTVMGRMEGINQRVDYWQAARYAIFEAKEPMTPEQFYIVALPYFKYSWEELELQLKRGAQIEKISVGKLLGKIITGEIASYEDF